MLPSLVLALLPCVAALRAAPLGASAAAAPPVAAAPVSCEALVLRLFGGAAGPRGADTAGFDAAGVAAACAENVVWDDVSLAAPVIGRGAVRAMLDAKFPPGARLVPERVADGVTSGGFTWHRAALGTSAGRGLRGTTYTSALETRRGLLSGVKLRPPFPPLPPSSPPPLFKGTSSSTPTAGSRTRARRPSRSSSRAPSPSSCSRR